MDSESHSHEWLAARRWQLAADRAVTLTALHGDDDDCRRGVEQCARGDRRSWLAGGVHDGGPGDRSRDGARSSSTSRRATSGRLRAASPSESREAFRVSGSRFGPMARASPSAAAAVPVRGVSLPAGRSLGCRRGLACRAARPDAGVRLEPLLLRHLPHAGGAHPATASIPRPTCGASPSRASPTSR